MKESRIYSERTSLNTIIVSIIIVLIGIIILVVAANVTNTVVQNVMITIGSLLIGTVAISLLWELRIKRAFLDELMVKVKVAQSVRQAGLLDVSNDFQHGIDWQDLFRNARELDIFFSYGSTWRGIYENQLRLIARNANFKVRVILPDLENARIMSELAQRFSKEPAEVERRIKEAADYFVAIFGGNQNEQCSFSLWYLSIAPVYSFYRFDHKAVVAFYTHAGGRGVVPTFIIEEGGSLFQFIVEELDKCLQPERKLTRQIYPAAPQKGQP